MDRSRLNIAKTGESYAVAHLEARGYKILAQNYRAVRGEIDLVAQDGDCIVFVEVKTRRSLKFGLPQAAVTGTETSDRFLKLPWHICKTKNALMLRAVLMLSRFICPRILSC